MRIARSTFPLMLMLLCLSGCVALENLDELSVMGQYSRDKDDQHREVKSINDHYDTLTKVIAEGHIGDYKDETSFTHSFGDPILKKDMGDGTERWLYRYAIYRYAKDKVYVYFDRGDRMVQWEKVPCPSFF